MKALTLAVAISLIASNAFAGALGFEEPVESEVIVEEDAPMGSSGGWIIPLVIAGIIVLLVANNSSDSTPNQNLTNQN